MGTISRPMVFLPISQCIDFSSPWSAACFIPALDLHRTNDYIRLWQGRLGLRYAYGYDSAGSTLRNRREEPADGLTSCLQLSDPSQASASSRPRLQRPWAPAPAGPSTVTTASQGQLNFGQRGEAPMLGAGALYQVALVGLVLRSW